MKAIVALDAIVDRWQAPNMAFQHRQRCLVRTTQRPSRSLMNEKVFDLLAQRQGRAQPGSRDIRGARAPGLRA